MVERGGAGGVLGGGEVELFLDRGGVAVADGCQETGEFGGDGRGRGVLFNFDAEVDSLVDPGAEYADFFGGKGAGGGHLHAAVAADNAFDEFAGGAVARVDDDAVIAAAHGVLALVEAEARLLDVFAVAGVALGGEDGFDVFFVVNFDGCGGRESRLGGEGEQGCQEEGGAHARTIRSRNSPGVKGG